MRVGLIMILTILTLSGAARAEAVVEDLLVRRNGDQVNVRVTLRNPGATRQPGPIVVDLYARADESQPWQRIKTWRDIRFLQPGYKVSRDLFEENSALLHQLAAGGRFQVKAAVSAPGLKQAVEKTSWYDTESGQ